ncbi:hypothetical protein BC941DRAFT_437272 [Chlamydoabsidia padenii]|nr:hypothetical protein BC941DRAFT_437272 [Chlamydoabsidia padenii]
MNSINKRRVDIWEDEWEKEANVTNKRTPPNKTAAYTSILEHQHSQLSETCTDLEASLAFLTTKLESLEVSLTEKRAQAIEKQQQHRQELARSIDRCTVGFMKQQKGCLGMLHENNQDLDRVLESNRALSTTLDQLLLDYESKLPLIDDLSKENGLNQEKRPASQQDQDDHNLNQVMIMHDELEHRYINSKSHIEGYQARAQVLEKELRKMNGLPQILPILKSTTETYEKEIQQYQRSQAKLPLSENIKALCQARVEAPLLMDQQIKKTKQIRQTATQLKKLHQRLIKQRAIQQLLLFSYQVETKHLLSYKHALMAYIQDLQKEKDMMITRTTPMKQQTYHQPQNQDIMPRIKQLITTHHQNKAPLLDPSVDPMQMTDDQVVKLVKKLVATELAWNKKWSDDTNDNLDAIRLLDQSKHELARTLFGDSASREKLDIKPKSYDDLQWTLESALNDLELEADTLETEYEANDALFKNRRSFVSLFFTDPFSFESKMEGHIDSLQSHINT